MKINENNILDIKKSYSNIDSKNKYEIVNLNNEIINIKNQKNDIYEKFKIKKILYDNEKLQNSEKIIEINEIKELYNKKMNEYNIIKIENDKFKENIKLMELNVTNNSNKCELLIKENKLIDNKNNSNILKLNEKIKKLENSNKSFLNLINKLNYDINNLNNLQKIKENEIFKLNDKIKKEKIQKDIYIKNLNEELLQIKKDKKQKDIFINKLNEELKIEKKEKDDYIKKFNNLNYENKLNLSKINKLNNQVNEIQKIKNNSENKIEEIKKNDYNQQIYTYELKIKEFNNELINERSKFENIKLLNDNNLKRIKELENINKHNLHKKENEIIELKDNIKYKNNIFSDNYLIKKTTSLLIYNYNFNIVIDNENNIKNDCNEIKNDIPKKIFITNKSLDDIPKNIFENIKNINKNYEIYFFDDEDCYNFLNNFFNKDYAILFKNIKQGPIKSDFWRLCVLYVFGGIYFDIDIKHIEKIDNIIENNLYFSSVLSASDDHIFQAFIACTAKNNIIKECINYFINKNIKRISINNNIQYWGENGLTGTWDMYYILKNKINNIKEGYYFINNNKIKILKEYKIGSIDNIINEPTNIDKCTYGVKFNDRFLFKSRMDEYDSVEHKFL